MSPPAPSELRERLVARHGSIRRAAAAIDPPVSYSHLVNVTAGRVQPTRELIEVLSRHLGVPVEDLFPAETLATTPYPHNRRTWASKPILNRGLRARRANDAAAESTEEAS